ncbi:hypothetical protein P9281_02555 [Caballeronia sp. LP003]|uniref:hypothetical protein n=1 Tax=Caballeronia sp. LP003 TaxID=3038551 RepID=UPI002864A2FA|nr:hypothetical protein [Caballeronia sp. LP003]MDR5785433.1 hypothetical protein [Caballeronia sp. LP003]
MSAPSHVYTISCVAKMLNEPEEWLEELANMNLEPEDGCLGVIDDLDVPPDEVISITAFTDAGIEALKELVADAKRADLGTYEDAE